MLKEFSGNLVGMYYSKDLSIDYSDDDDSSKRKAASRIVTPDELSANNSTDSCWQAIYGKVYDLTEFAPKHPPGPEGVWVFCGKVCVVRALS